MATLYAYSPNGTQATLPVNIQGFTQSLVANGWCRLPNGWIFQWGAATSTTVYYNIDVSNAFTVVAVGTPSGARENLAVGSVYSTQFSWSYWSTKGTCYWMMIGN